jgi:VanZ family protein
MNKPASFFLLWIYVTVLIYVNLSPFDLWHWPAHHAPWDFLWQFNNSRVTTIVIKEQFFAYLPLGLLLSYLGLKIGRSIWVSIVIFPLMAVILAIVLESLQPYMTDHGASRTHVVINACGVYFGALLVFFFDVLGGRARWDAFATTYLLANSSVACALLWLWPFALLRPMNPVFLLGHWNEWFYTELIKALPSLNNTTLTHGSWLHPSSVALGILTPGLLSFLFVRSLIARIVALFSVYFLGFFATCCAWAWLWNWGNALNWLNRPVILGLIAAFIILLLTSLLPLRVCAWFLFVVILSGVFALTITPIDWFNSLRLSALEDVVANHRVLAPLRCLSWLWPYAVAIFAISFAMAGSSTKSTPIKKTYRVKK